MDESFVVTVGIKKQVPAWVTQMAAKKTTSNNVRFSSTTDALRRSGEAVSVAKDGTFVIFGTPQRELVNQFKMAKTRTTPIQTDKLTKEQISTIVRRMKVV